MNALNGRLWNPLRCGGTSLPLPVLLSAKLVLMTFYLKGYLYYLPDRHTPFLPILEELGTPEQFETFLIWAIACAAPLVIFNVRPRMGCFLIGLASMTAILGSRPHFAYSRLYGTCWLLLVGLYEAPLGALLMRSQVVLLYFGAGLNKLLDPDWINGQYFESWMHDKLANRVYVAAAASLPELWLSKLMGWFTIASELVMAGSFGFGWVRVAIGTGVLLHGGALLLTQEDFGAFFASVLISYLAFFTSPKRVEVTLGQRASRWSVLIKTLDLESQFQIREEGTDRLEVDVDGARFRGLAAAQRLILLNPLSYFIFFLALTASPFEALRIPVFVAGVFVLLPVFHPRPQDHLEGPG